MTHDQLQSAVEACAIYMEETACIHPDASRMDVQQIILRHFSPFAGEGWIACSERMPEEGQRVRVANKGWEAIGRWYPGKWPNIGFNKDLGGEYFTHWHALPTFPAPNVDQPQPEVKVERPLVCEHGRLARSCVHCELQEALAENAALLNEISRLTAEASSLTEQYKFMSGVRANLMAERDAALQRAEAAEACVRELNDNLTALRDQAAKLERVVEAAREACLVQGAWRLDKVRSALAALERKV